MKKIDKYVSSLPLIENKKVIITGANSGLGYALADHCLTKGASIVLACRNLERAQKAKDNLLISHPNSDISIMIYDQSSIQGCREFAKEIIEKQSDFYALVLNAGVLRVNKGVLTKDGFPMVSGINAFGVLAILDSLSDFLSKTNEEKRVVIQGSLASRMEKYKNFENYAQNSNRPYFEQYANSKNMALNVFLEFAKNNTNENLKYLNCEPGISSSNIIQNFPKWCRGFCAFFYGLLFQSSREGSLPALDLVCNSSANGDYSVPKHMFLTRGLPKRYKVKQKHIRSDVPGKMREILSKI